MNDTRLQFGHLEGASVVLRAEPRTRAVCSACGQHFSADGRFCPFDGEPLRLVDDFRPPLDPLLGTMIDGRYEVMSVLGEGGMGIVYAVRHCSLGKRFALKLLRQDLAGDREIAARFTQEARTAASVSHPGLVEITDFGTLPAGQPFFVMELLEGASLSSLIRRGGPLPVARAIDIIRQVAEALGAAHDLSIVHRDLKPDNIHVAVDDAGHDRVKILDFGLAKVIGSNGLTRAGIVFGTPHYMSPEQAMGEATDHRSDIYALGVVMYEMFVGHVPFEADSYMGVLTKHMYMVPTPPTQIVATEQLQAIEHVILRCLEKKPANRYSTLRDLVADLEHVFTLTSEPRRLSRPRRVPPPSLLADELELPSREELSIELDQAGLRPFPRWPVVLVGVLFLLGIVSALGARRWHSSSSPRAVISGGDAGALVAATPVSAGLRLAAVAASSPEASVATPTVADSTAPPSVDRAPLRRPARPARRLKSSVRKEVPVVGGSEIVDPWAK